MDFLDDYSYSSYHAAKYLTCRTCSKVTKDDVTRTLNRHEAHQSRIGLSWYRPSLETSALNRTTAYTFGETNTYSKTLGWDACAVGEHTTQTTACLFPRFLA